MDDAPLNQAHMQQRRAESLLRHRQFDQSVVAHKRAIELLKETCTLTDHPSALSSLKLQIEQNERQINLVYMKKQQHENEKKLAEKVNADSSGSNLGYDSSNDDDIESTIFRTIETHDSLIRYLCNRGAGSDVESCSMSEPEDKIDGTENVSVNKHPKNDATIIEELKLLSDQLRDLVQILLTQLDDRSSTIETLKNQIYDLELELHKVTKANSNVKNVTDSSGGTSPYVFSPCSELSEVDILRQHVRDIPPFTPLGMPAFVMEDLKKLDASTSTSSNNQ